MGHRPWSNFGVAPTAFEPPAQTSPARLVTVRGAVMYWVFGVSKDVSGVGNRNWNPISCNRRESPASVIPDLLLVPGSFPGPFCTCL